MKNFEECAVLTFRRADGQKATIATNGKRHVTQIGEKLETFRTLWKAIASLECRNYSIVTEDFKTI